MFANPDIIIKEGKIFSYVECDWLGYIIKLHNVKIIKIKYMSVLGTFVEINTNQLVHIIKKSHQDIFTISDVSVKAAFNKSFKYCNNCQQENYYHLINPITVAEMQIKDIQI